MSAATIPTNARVSRVERRLLTPEGVPLRIELAEPGERLVAFLIDVMLATVAALTLELLAFLSPEKKFTLPATLFLAFVIRNCYFIIFELRWAGGTPGKRMLGLRVINRRGGPLRPGSVLARNLTRQAEFFFPVELLLVTHGWVWSLTDVVPVALWLAAMFVLMVVSKDRLRAGDLIAGTIVISLPKRLLLEDLAAERQTRLFSDRQLEVYGVLELQVLEDILRRPYSADSRQVTRDICGRIQRRIGWSVPVDEEKDPAGFLRDFYTAQRAFLEAKKNMGEERADKFHSQERKEGA